MLIFHILRFTKARDIVSMPTGDAYRPRLRLNMKPGASNYVNAVYVNVSTIV